MTKEELFEQIQRKQSYLCVGLDTDAQKIPVHLQATDSPVLAFNRQIIDATVEHCVAYKLNTAFYEAQGAAGWQALQQTIAYIPRTHFIIADAKRGDIGNTSALYARAFFEHLQADAITVAPYMGEDSVKPFLSFPEKWVILLALTSNSGSHDFQLLQTGQEEKLFERVIKTSQTWADDSQLMYVVGATQAEQFTRIRQLIPDHFLLVPGVGAQGGNLQAVSQSGMNRQCGLLVNASRAIIYASTGEDFAERAAQEARQIQREMAGYLAAYL